jgi:RNA recognition motif-containing protein
MVLSASVVVNVKMSSVSSRSTPPTSRLKRKRDSSSDSSSGSEPEQTDDALVLSHAAKRKQRKASLKKATSSPTKKEKGDASHPVKRENSIWVGNLSYKTTPESLRRFFDGVGEVTRVHLPTKLGKVSPGETVRRENRGCDSVPATSRFVY